MSNQDKAMPEFVAFKADKHGVHSLVDGATVAPAARIPTADPLTIARVIHKMLTAKVQVSEYAFFCPKYDADGKMVHAKDAKGHVMLTTQGRAKIETTELSRALKEVEEGTREVTLKRGRYGSFRINILATRAATASPAKQAAYFDVAAFFTNETPKKK